MVEILETIMKFFAKFSLAPSERVLKRRQLVGNSYQSVKVIGRGTINIDPSEVTDTDEFRAARAKAKAIVNG
jgi:hypothetical protein